MSLRISNLNDILAAHVKRVKGALPLIVFAYLVLIRTHAIARTFWLFGDQILYWRIALGSWRDLPIGGGPSQVGGTTLGPIFCWVLWASRHLIGPFTDNLPHAGGIGLSILQSAADAFLFVAIWRRFSSLPLAIAVTLLAASAPYDMALTATIWNPPLAVACAKTAMAFVLLGGRSRSMWWSVGAIAAALFAVQAHSSGLFFAVPVVASFTLRELVDRRWMRAAFVIVVTAATLLLVETPYLVDRVMHPNKPTSPAVIVDSVAYTMAHPVSIRPAAAFRAVANACEFILLRPWTAFGWMGFVLVLCALVTAYRERRDVTIVCATVLPLAAAVVGFSFWQGMYDHYWYLVLAPGAALTIGLALTAWKPAATLISIALAALVLWSQPARIADSMTFHRLPEYEVLVRGAREIRRYTPEVQAIRTDFALPGSVDPSFLYSVLGGRFSGDARFVATIRRTGDVVFTPVAPAGRSGRSK